MYNFKSRLNAGLWLSKILRNMWYVKKMCEHKIKWTSCTYQNTSPFKENFQETYQMFGTGSAIKIWHCVVMIGTDCCLSVY